MQLSPHPTASMKSLKWWTRMGMLCVLLLLIIGTNSHNTSAMRNEASNASTVNGQTENCDQLPVVSFFGYDGNLDDLLDGYCVEGYYIPALITGDFYYKEPPHDFVTRALFQTDGLLEQTAAMNNIDWSNCDGLIALMSPATLGWRMYIQMPDSDQWYCVIQADVVKREHYYFHVVWHQSALELNYDLAEHLGVVDMVNPDKSRYTYGMRVCIVSENPQDVCVGEAPNFIDWFWENVRYVSR